MMTQGQIPKSHPWHHPSSDEMSDYSTCQSTLSDVRHPRLKKEEKRRRKGKGGNFEGVFTSITNGRALAVTPRGLGIQDPSWPPDHRGRIAVLIRRSSDAIGSLARSSCDDKVVWVGACDVVIGHVHDRCVRVRVTISGYRRWLGLTSGGSQGEKDHPRCTGKSISLTVSLIAKLSLSFLVGPEEVNSNIHSTIPGRPYTDPGHRSLVARNTRTAAGRA